MVDWVNGLIIPVIEISIIGGLIAFVGYFIFKAVYNAWSKEFKFYLRYKIMKTKYPEATLKWILNCMSKGIGWYDAKKMLMVKMYPQDQINETLWIYDQVINELKGGVRKDGRTIEGSNRKNQSKPIELP